MPGTSSSEAAGHIVRRQGQTGSSRVRRQSSRYCQSLWNTAERELTSSAYYLGRNREGRRSYVLLEAISLKASD